MRAILSGSGPDDFCEDRVHDACRCRVVALVLAVAPDVFAKVSFPEPLKIASMVDLRSLIPCPVVAETRMVSAGLMPRRRNSLSGSESPRSDLLRSKRTGFFDLRADLAMSLSLSSGYLELSRVKRMRSAESMASAI